MAPRISGVCSIAQAFLVLLTLGLLTCSSRAEGPPPSTEDFDVRPGGQEHSFSRTWGEYSCTFTYAAQGGTNEQWQMSVATSEDGIFSCAIWRPQGKSYLYFMQFKAEVKGCKIVYAEAYSQAASSGHKDIALKSEEYEVGETAVTHKQGAFGSTLAKIVVVANCQHDEL